jgi:NADPH:quinone reductase-like Zn-dependent oxidoreductase
MSRPARMSAQVPSTMRALAIPFYCKPTEYDVAILPTPIIYRPDHVLIKVTAASVNPIDVKMASGISKMVHKDK